MITFVLSSYIFIVPILPRSNAQPFKALKTNGHLCIGSDIGVRLF